MQERAYIVVVDDDESVRESLPDLLREFGYEAEAFSSADGLLASDRLTQIKCLILDISMPGMSGLELQNELIRRKHDIPIVFITAHADEATRVHMRERGAVECLLKPFSDTTLLQALKTALGTS